MERTFSRLVNKLETKGAADILKYASVPGVIPLSAGSPSQEAFPTKELAEIAAAVFQEDAVTALTLAPARAVRLDHQIGSLAVGKQADLVLLNPDLTLDSVYVDGEKVR